MYRCSERHASSLAAAGGADEQKFTIHIFARGFHSRCALPSSSLTLAIAMFPHITIDVVAKRRSLALPRELLEP